MMQIWFNNCINNEQKFYYIKQIKTYEKIDSMFRNEINEIFAYNKMFSILNKNTFKYVKLLFSSTSSKSAGLLSNYQFSISEDNYKSAKEVFDAAMNELSDIKGIIIGHSPQKNILYIFNNQTKKILFNIDNLISIGQNQKDVIRQYNYDGSIIFKEAKIMYINKSIVKEISIEIDLYKSFISESNFDKPKILSNIEI